MRFLYFFLFSNSGLLADAILIHPKGGKLNNPQRSLLRGINTFRTNDDFLGIGPVEKVTIPGIPTSDQGVKNINTSDRTRAGFIGPVQTVTIPPLPSEQLIQKFGIINTPRSFPYHLFNPTPDNLLRTLSPDRPDATESPLTIDAGRFALEASLFDYRRDGGHETFTYGQLNFKAGLTLNTDFQTIVDLYSDGDEEGFGDVTLRLKHNLWGNDGGDTALALMPFVKIPTNTDASNNQWEGGLIIPWSTVLADSISLGLMAEFDSAFNEDTGDHEFEFLHTAALGFEVTEKTGVYLEYIGIAGKVDYQAYLASGMTHSVKEHLILDFGVQGGLNKNSEDFGFFTGFTKRF